MLQTSYNYHFLPSYSQNLSRVLIQCKTAYLSGAYDFSEVNYYNATSVSELYPIPEHRIMNEATEHDYMWVQINSQRGNEEFDDSCFVDFKYLDESYVKRFTYSFEGQNYQECLDYNVHSMSQSEEFFVLGVDRGGNPGGQYVVNFNTGEEIRISETLNSFLRGTWLPNSNSFVFFEAQQEILRLYNADTNQFLDLLSGSEIKSFIPDLEIGNSDAINIDAAQYFGSHSISFLTNSDSSLSGGKAWSYSRVDFNEDFSTYQVFQTQTTTQVPGIKCGSDQNNGAPSLRFITGNPEGPYRLDGCSTDILVGMPTIDDPYGLYITTYDRISIHTNVTGLYSECTELRVAGLDFDNDGRSNRCDFDIDGDGVPNWLDSCHDTVSPSTIDFIGDGCFRIEGIFQGDFDLDGINIGDECPNGYKNWSTDRWIGPKPYDYDSDGCHDIVEDLDDDNDGIPDDMDDCPLRGNGHTDLDQDGLCEGDDFDDDGDGFSDLDEVWCGSNSTDSASLPLDTDSDLICDEIDDDIDGDNVSNLVDIFPLDILEWNDLDSDGFGNNSDDCVGTYGTSTVDRLGCLDQDGDGLSDLNDIAPYDAKVGLDEYDGPRLDQTSTTQNKANSENESWSLVLISVGIIAGVLITALVIRKKLAQEDESIGEEFEDYHDYSSQGVNEQIDDGLPDYSLIGEQHENGYEVLEYPESSGEWWWKDEENRCWVIWE
jgi:hypothetical protein